LRRRRDQPCLRNVILSQENAVDVRPEEPRRTLHREPEAQRPATPLRASHMRTKDLWLPRTVHRCAVPSGKESSAKRSRGVAVKYNLAFMNHALWAGDNGRWWATTTATVIIIGISPAQRRNLLLSATRSCWNDFSTKCGNSAKRRSRYEVENQYGRI